MQLIKKVLMAASLLAAGSWTADILACGYCYSLPEEYYVYRITPNYLKRVEVDPAYLPGSNENCQLWMQQLGAETIGPEEVYEIVYKADLDSLSSLAVYNAFASILLDNPEALKVLRLAKDCEKARFAVTQDPWYYPVSDDSEHQNLERILARARDCTSELFRSRYFLQEIRALFTLGRYEEIISRWEAEKDSLPDDILKQLVFRYIAGAEFNIGETDKAVEMFLSIGDLTSALSCKQLYAMSDLEAAVELDVNYKGIREILENDMRAYCFAWNGAEEYQSDLLADIRKLCDKALAKNPADKAVWYYTAAYIEYYNHHYGDARKLLKKARKAPGADEVLSGSIRVLDILSDARSSRHNFFYERRLLRDLKWLDGQIVANLTDEVREETAGDFGWKMRANLSYYYWNDMLRALTLGILAPDYVKAGKTTKALQLANMADNRLPALTGVDRYDYTSGSFSVTHGFPYMEYMTREDDWKPLYSNNFFEIADTLATDKVAAYLKRALHPKNGFDRFTAERGYVDAGYLNDIVGTKLIRDRRFKEAVSYLEKLPEGFQNRLNTKEYLMPLGNEAKLLHARSMVQYEEEMRSRDPREAAEAKWLYGQQLMLQYRLQWALSYYGWSEYVYGYVERTNEEGMNLANKLITEAMAEMPDPEYAAQMQYEMCNFRTVAEKYPDSEVAGIVRANCDTWEDYHREMPVHWNQ